MIVQKTPTIMNWTVCLKMILNVAKLLVLKIVTMRNRLYTTYTYIQTHIN